MINPLFVKTSPFQIKHGDEQEPKMNEYDIIETHREDGDDMQETNCGENATKTVEEEVLLRMTNLDSKTIKLSGKNQEDFKKQGKYNCVCHIIFNT